ncbi:ThuA domain-containing protein [Pseudalkalibacillus caeni]|uniref:ThuA-like domain-containing protein n=1 Tax=Exobacillus caeni TaxID=2574798 RepID=A0A5R9FBX9_9BACL|nr:ThuA domain-containing protein [Pseudalkalibacillus caeni]TLS38393.1 hypothetical protein FCL54_04420 [Pseudalkalibacillus caeni]
MKKDALIISGGWEGHSPEEFTECFKNILEEQDFQVSTINSLDLKDYEKQLKCVDLIIPNWTTGRISFDSLTLLLEAVQEGAGLAGIHGGMGDAFREQTEYQYMVGGQFVAHPGGQNVVYEVTIKDHEHEITKGVAGTFTVNSEMYYMHVDPGNHVIASTKQKNGEMPVAWVKKYGEGKIFYCSVGHTPSDLTERNLYQLIKNGFLWASNK